MFKPWRIHDVFFRKIPISLFQTYLLRNPFTSSSSSTSSSISPQKSSKYNQEKTGMNVHQTQLEKRTNIYSYSLYRMSAHVQHARVVLENIQFRFWQFQTGKFYHFSLQMGTRGNCFLFISNFEFLCFFSCLDFFFFDIYLNRKNIFLLLLLVCVCRIEALQEFSWNFSKPQIVVWKMFNIFN